MANPSNSSNSGSEMRYIIIIIAMALIVGLLIFVQLLRAQPVDNVASLIIGVCFLVAVIATGMWGSKSGI